MSSPALTNSAATTTGSGRTKHISPSVFSRGKIIFLVAAAILIVAVAVCLAMFWNRFWPFTEAAVVEDLKEASNSTVTIRSSHRTYFPSPGCVLEGIEFRHGADQWRLITIDKLTIQGSYSGILTNRVPRIIADGGHVYVPAMGRKMTFSTQHSKLVVEELIANGTIIEFASQNPKQQALRFDVHQGLLHNVQWESAIDYDLKFHNPEPPGEITARGKFGAWIHGNPGETPISGEYTFQNADLGFNGGIAGTMDSKGKFSGVLKHIDIGGDTQVPDFDVESGGRKFKLVTHYDAYVDGTQGDTFLKRVDARWGRTSLAVRGSVAGAKGRKGKAALLDLSSRQGRIEDILGLFVRSPRAPMSGAVSFKAKAEIPPGDEEFLKKVKFQGEFGIDDGSFTKAETQKNVNELSAGARGEKMDDAETVLTDLKGSVKLEGGIATFTDLSFGIPGATANMHGTYNLLNYKINLHGQMRVDTKISKTTTGVKSLFLKAMDPFFKKKKKGEIVPVHIQGTYKHPQFGLDFNRPDNQKQPHK